MMDEVLDDPHARGRASLAAGDWEAARTAFSESIDADDGPESHDGLGLALWWLRDVDGALSERERAYAAFRKSGERARAALIALWLSREYAEALANEPISKGWLARAQGLIDELPAGVEQGWLAITRGRLVMDPADARADAAAAAEAGRTFHDAELEASGLALLGLACIAAGDVDEGMAALDEAMVIATGGEVVDQAVFGDICCVATRGAEEAGDITRLMRWNEVVMTFMQRSGHAGLLTFCGTCCAEVLLAGGNIEEAEGWLVRTLRELEGTGHRARCAHPAAKLAELRVLQGRIEEAERLLNEYEGRPEALRASARVHLAAGETAVAAALLHRRLNQVGDGLLAVPLLSLLVEVQVAQGDLDGARTNATRLHAIADRVGTPRLAATAALASGRVAAASGSTASARTHLDAAIEGFGRLEMPLEAARARVELARTLLDVEPEVSLSEAKIALDAAEASGARRLADEAAAIVRDLGGPARTGPKGIGLLSKREQEVLGLLGEGLSNAEIAARLFISTKTAGHHVSNVLAKLHLRTRSEAAAFAIRYGVEEPVRE